MDNSPRARIATHGSLANSEATVRSAHIVRSDNQSVCVPGGRHVNPKISLKSRLIY